MLTCVYHPIDDRRIVDADEAEQLIASGVWFDSPAKARDYRAKVEQEIKDKKPKEDKSNERRQKSSVKQRIR